MLCSVAIGRNAATHPVVACFSGKIRQKSFGGSFAIKRRLARDKSNTYLDDTELRLKQRQREFCKADPIGCKHHFGALGKIRVGVCSKHYKHLNAFDGRMVFILSQVP